MRRRSWFSVLGSWVVALWMCPASSAVEATSAASGIGEGVIVGGVAAGRAELIAGRVARIRHDIHTLLTGSAAVHPWVPACRIHVHGDRTEFSRAVAGAPRTARGATTIEFDDDRVRLRRIDVIDGGGEAVPDALAHEVAHVVLAEWFPDVPPPRWADEGLAVLCDDPAKQAGHHDDFRAALARGQAWTIAGLMAMDYEPAEPGRQRVFYGQSAALTRRLLERRGGPAFLRLLRDITDHGAATVVPRLDDIRAVTAADLADSGGPRPGRPRVPDVSDPGAAP